MLEWKFKIGLIFLIALLHSCSNSKLENECSKLESLDRFKQNPKEGEWLESHKEPFKSLNTYIKSKPLRVSKTRKNLYMVKIGNFDSVSNQIFEITKLYLREFYQIETKEINQLSANLIPQNHRRENGQLDAKYILDSVLAERIPIDAHSIIGFANFDLYPGNDWNYVFGLASYTKRVGVWSLSHFLNSSCDTIDFNLALKRTLCVASHETGHMFGLSHCSVYECNMNGANSLYELDSQVNWLCHDCLTKICWNRNISPLQHIDAMKNFYKSNFSSLKEEEYYSEASKILNR